VLLELTNLSPRAGLFRAGFSLGGDSSRPTINGVLNELVDLFGEPAGRLAAWE
jgi:hypothetical protein